MVYFDVLVSTQIYPFTVHSFDMVITKISPPDPILFPLLSLAISSTYTSSNAVIGLKPVPKHQNNVYIKFYDTINTEH
jgi:hypothetical protein